MAQIMQGSLIGIPCVASVGAFEGECLVEFDTMDGKISGFTASENIQELNGESHIKAKVVAIESDHYVIMVEGSFFSTNGLANVGLDSSLPLMAA